MKYIVDHPKGYRHAIKVCIQNQMPFILSSAKEVVLTAPTKIGIDALIKAGTTVAKPDQGEICVLDSQREGGETAPDASSAKTQPVEPPPPHSLLDHISKWFQK